MYTLHTPKVLEPRRIFGSIGLARIQRHDGHGIVEIEHVVGVIARDGPAADRVESPHVATRFGRALSVKWAEQGPIAAIAARGGVPGLTLLFPIAVSL